MKRLIPILFLLLPGLAFADRWDSAVSKNAGNYLETYTTPVSSTTATLFIDGANGVKSSNIDIFNNSPMTLWIGTNTATLRVTGFPILSSTTFTLDGTHTGSVYGLMDAGATATWDIRTIFYQKNDALR